jgi:hypothetical protein
VLSSFPIWQKRGTAEIAKVGEFEWSIAKSGYGMAGCQNQGGNQNDWPNGERHWSGFAARVKAKEDRVPIRSAGRLFHPVPAGTPMEYPP